MFNEGYASLEWMNERIKQKTETNQPDPPAEIPLSEITPGYYIIQSRVSEKDISIVECSLQDKGLSSERLVVSFFRFPILIDPKKIFKWIRRIEYP